MQVMPICFLENEPFEDKYFYKKYFFNHYLVPAFIWKKRGTAPKKQEQRVVFKYDFFNFL